MEDLIQQLVGVADSWKTLGALAGALALINFLVYLTKKAGGEGAPGWLGKLFGWIRPAWRPYIAIVLGLLGGFFTALQQGKTIMQAVMAAVLGAFLGLGASGGHEAIMGAKPTEAAKKDAATAVAKAMEGPEHEVQKKVDEMKANLDAAVKEPDKKARMKKLAALANADVASRKSS